MYAINQSLKHPVDFDNAMFFCTKVAVWKDGVMIDLGGYIDGHNHEGVMVNGEYYTKAEYDFRVR